MVERKPHRKAMFHIHYKDDKVVGLKGMYIAYSVPELIKYIVEVHTKGLVFESIKVL